MGSVTVNFTLRFPPQASILKFEELCGLWGFLVIRAGTHRRKATVSMPAETFKKMFGESPRKGSVVVPFLLADEKSGFIDAIEVMETQ